MHVHFWQQSKLCVTQEKDTMKDFTYAKESMIIFPINGDLCQVRWPQIHKEIFLISTLWWYDLGYWIFILGIKSYVN